MIFPIWYFDDYSQAAMDLQRCAEIAAAEEGVQDSRVGEAPHIAGTKEDFHNLHDTISKGTMHG